MLLGCSQWTGRLLIREHRARWKNLPLRITRNAIQIVTAQRVRGSHTPGVAEVETEAEAEVIRKGGKAVKVVMVEGVAGREIKKWGVQNGGV